MGEHGPALPPLIYLRNRPLAGGAAERILDWIGSKKIREQIFLSLRGEGAGGTVLNF